MSEINTKVIINFLPFPADFKLDLLERFDSLPKAEQLRISDIMWEGFYTIYDLRFQENFDKGIQEAEKTGQMPDDTFYGKIVEKMDKEIEAALRSAGEGMDLSAARKSMEQIVQAIKAAKTPPKPQKTS